MHINEQRVREFAYQIWESEGRPVGHSDRHWAMASKLAAADEHIPAEPAAQTVAVTPPRKSRAKAAAAAPAKSLIDTNPIVIDTPAIAASAQPDEAAKPAKKPSKPRKSKAAENESA